MTTSTCGVSCAPCCMAFGARKCMRPKTARQASESFIHYVPDIIITDWEMPIFDGLELTQMIRQPGTNGNPMSDHHADGPFRRRPASMSARDARRALSSSPSRFRRTASIGASSTSWSIRGRSSGRKPISVPTGVRQREPQIIPVPNAAKGAAGDVTRQAPLLEDEVFSLTDQGSRCRSLTSPAW